MNGVPRKMHFRPFWFFVLFALVLVLLNAFFRTPIAGYLHVSWTWSQFVYALVSLELCAAIYFYGVGSLSPHWRPDPGAQPSGVKAALLAPAPSAGSHPLGPKLTKPVAPASSAAASTQAGHPAS
jgi:hypothetical protein